MTTIKNNLTTETINTLIEMLGENTLNKMVEVLDYCKMIDRNGSWEYALIDITDYSTSLSIELDTLESTLTEWLEEEKSGGVDHLATEQMLKAVKRMKREELAK